MFNPIGGLINTIVGIIEFLLSLRFIFKFFGFASTSSFFSWLNNFTQPIVNPFVGLLPNFQLGGFLVESCTIIALIVIGIVGYLLAAIFLPPTRYPTY